MKTAAERGQIGAWAYEARAEADLSVPEVVRQLAARGQAVTEPTLRGIEGGSKKPGRRLLRELASIYGKPVPGEPVADVPDAVAAAIDRQTEMLERVLMRLGDLLDEARRQGSEEREAILVAVADVRANLRPRDTTAGTGRRSRVASGQ